MHYPGRRDRLAARLEEIDAEAFFVTRLPNVRYLTGFTGSNAQLLLGRDEQLFLTDGRYGEQSRHEVPDLRRAVYSGALGAAFHEACSQLSLSRVAFESGGVTFLTYEDLASGSVELVPTRSEVERLRWVKEPDELKRLEAAQAIADEAFDEILRRLQAGVTERQIALDLDVAMRRAGADGSAFDPIVAFGPNAAEPHHRATERPLDRGDVVMLDFGSVVEGYRSDMTRSVALGEPSRKIREIHQIVRVAQRTGVDAVRAGATGGEADSAARDVVREAGYAANFTHSLGHGVGLETHEGPTLRAAGVDVLPTGTVVTVEPGIYLEGVGGVRIEDMVAVGEGPARVIPRATKDLVVL